MGRSYAAQNLAVLVGEKGANLGQEVGRIAVKLGFKIPEITTINVDLGTELPALY